MNQAIRLALEPNKNVKTNIMATVGPATKDYEVLKAMVESGVTFFRFNGAHIGEVADTQNLSYNQAMEIAYNIRSLRRFFRQSIGIYFDLGGPKIRVKHVISIQKECVKDGKKEIKKNFLHPSKGETVIIRAWNTDLEAKFINDLEKIEKDIQKRKWDNQDFIQNFFSISKRTTENVLMLGNEVTSFDIFDINKPINLKDGWCQLKIIKKLKDELICEVTYVDSKFEFWPEQSANPYRHIFPEIITVKDKRDIETALRMGADIISLSFVCSPTDAADLRKIIQMTKEVIRKDKKFWNTTSKDYRRYIENHQIPIFAKIETAFAVLPDQAREYAEKKGLAIPFDPLREIAEEFDGLMVARGDLAVEVTKYMVPDLQRQVIKWGHLLNKPVIVATEMLESMRKGDASTRAEIMDINSAVHQEADILMLSGETANPKKPQKPEVVVLEMHDAIQQAENEREKIDHEKNFEALQNEREKILSDQFKGKELEKSISVSKLAQGNQVCVSARALDSKVIIASVKTGEAVQEIAYYRPSQKIIAITDDVLIAVRLLQYRGVYPVVMEKPLKRTLDEFEDIIKEIHDEIGIPYPQNYLFDWNKISEHDDSINSDNKRLKEFLIKNYNLNWINSGKIVKHNDKFIMISNKNNYLSLFLDDKEKKVKVEINGCKPKNGKPKEFIVVKQYGDKNKCLYIYRQNASFRFPGLVRVKPDYPNEHLSSIGECDVPNSLHEFSLNVNPYSVPEIERKYILSKNSHEILKKALKKDSSGHYYSNQYNFYFTDFPDNKLFKNEVMLRIRFEEIENRSQEQKNQIQEINNKDIKIYLTLKGKSTIIGSTKEEARPEKEFEITRDFMSQFKNVKMENATIDFNQLPDFYKKYIWERYRGLLEKKEGKGDGYSNYKEVKYKQIAKLKNNRNTFDMINGFVLELDEGIESNDFQLEVELKNDPHTTKHLNEYIHDKFCALGIPIVLAPDPKSWDSKSLGQIPVKLGKYPTKYLQALAISKEESQSIKERIQTINENNQAILENIHPYLKVSHEKYCEKCKKF